MIWKKREINFLKIIEGRGLHYVVQAEQGLPADRFLGSRVRWGLRARQSVWHCSGCACCQPDGGHAAEFDAGAGHARRSEAGWEADGSDAGAKGLCQY